MTSSSAVTPPFKGAGHGHHLDGAGVLDFESGHGTFIAGVIAKFIMPGSSNEPSGFLLTTILGIVGAFVASYLGQALGWYAAGEGAGLIGAIVGAIIVLFVWGFIAKRKT